MKKLCTCIFAALAIFSALPAMAAETSPGALKVLREPILLDYQTLPLLSVTFNHSTHKAFSCVLCHHKVTPEGALYAPCTTSGCHNVPGARERAEDSMFMAYHAAPSQRSCYGCHVRQAATHPEFIGCRPCHYRPLATKASK